MKGRTDFFQGGVYGKQRYWNAYVAAAAAFAAHQVTTDRTVTVGPASDHLTATFTASSVAGRVEGGYRFGLPFYGVTPYAAVQVQSIYTPGYSETAAAGAGGTAQTLASQNTTSTRTELGSWLDARVNAVLFRGRAAWVHDFNRDASITASFAAFPSPNFVVTGAQRPGDAALVSGLFEVPVFTNVTFSGRADGEFASHVTTWSGMGTCASCGEVPPPADTGLPTLTFIRRDGLIVTLEQHYETWPASTAMQARTRRL